jgi:hypothetical protein
MSKSSVRIDARVRDRRLRDTRALATEPDTMAAMDHPTDADTGERRTADVGPGDRPIADADAGDRPPAAEPGDHPPRASTRLERAPSERYAREPAPTTRGRAQATRAAGVAVAGAAVIAFLGGPLSMTGGLLAVSVVVGIVLGSTLRPRTAAAVGLAVGSVVVGLLGVWLFSRVEGGVLDPLAYLADVEGPLAPLQLILAAASAAVASR